MVLLAVEPAGAHSDLQPPRDSVWSFTTPTSHYLSEQGTADSTYFPLDVSSTLTGLNGCALRRLNWTYDRTGYRRVTNLEPGWERIGGMSTFGECEKRLNQLVTALQFRRTGRHNETTCNCHVCGMALRNGVGGWGTGTRGFLLFGAHYVRCTRTHM